MEGLPELGVLSHAIAVAADRHQVAVVNQAIDEGGRHNVITENVAPFLEAFIGREHAPLPTSMARSGAPTASGARRAIDAGAGAPAGAVFPSRGPRSGRARRPARRAPGPKPPSRLRPQALKPCFKLSNDSCAWNGRVCGVSVVAGRTDDSESSTRLDSESLDPCALLYFLSFRRRPSTPTMANPSRLSAKPPSGTATAGTVNAAEAVATPAVVVVMMISCVRE